MFERMFYAIVRTTHEHYRQYGGIVTENIIGSLHDTEDDAKRSLRNIMESQERGNAEHREQYPSLPIYNPEWRIAVIRVSELPEFFAGAPEQEAAAYNDTDPLF
jgi:hypothetical protein